MLKTIGFYGILAPAIIVIADQWSKLKVLNYFNVPVNICETNLRPGLAHELGPIFDLNLICNPGISFGLLGGDSSLKRWLLTIFAAVMCLVLIYTLTRVKDLLSKIGIALIIGGAIGNGIDRALFGAVTDFVDVTDWLPIFPYIFNVADSAITCGVIILLIASWKNDKAAKASSVNLS